MRFALASILMIATASASAGTQQQCEALMKPVEAKLAPMQKIKGETATPQQCAQAREVLKVYADYMAQADKMNCAFAYVSGQQIGGKEERAELMADLKKAYAEKCR